jgi:hypothetical protein
MYLRAYGWINVLFAMIVLHTGIFLFVTEGELVFFVYGLIIYLCARFKAMSCGVE